MTRFITKSNQRHRSLWMRAASVLFWVLVWQCLSVAIGQEILLVSPVRVLRSLFDLMRESTFWGAVGFSVFKILCGFLLALLMGTAFAVLSYKVAFIGELLYPLVAVINATPVASFVILALLWIRSANLCVLISFMMAFPIVYWNLSEGLNSVDRALLEMAAVFSLRPLTRVLYIYIPALLPFMISALSLSIGLCFKSGIAAEVIAQPRHSIGGALYEAKIFLDTPVMFAWTLAIVLISMLFEKAVRLLIAYMQAKLEGV